MRPEEPSLAALRRAVAADPSDGALAQQLRNLTRRIFGAEARRILGDRQAWAAAEEGPQDAAAYAVAEALAPEFSLVNIQRYACADQAHRIARLRHEASGIELHLLPGGEALIGSEDGPINERPRRGVVLPPFLMGRFPVLQREWDRVLSRRPPRRRFLGRFLRRREPEGAIEDRRLFDRPPLPIHYLRIDDIDRWLELLGSGLRLPSEAEWEYASRAGATAEYYWGDRPDHSYFWHGFNSSYHAHAPEEHADRANAFGLVDTLGNVLECCADAYIPDYREGPVDARPRFRAGEGSRVIRGGSFRHDAAGARCADRRAVLTSDRVPELGLRVARSLPEGLYDPPEGPNKDDRIGLPRADPPSSIP